MRVFNFLFKNAQIYAIDILPKNFLNSKSIKTIICDEGDFKKKKEISDQIGDLDLIIDDGSHIPKNQINNFEIFFEKLNEGGIYIIEDIGTSYVNAIGGDPKLSSEKNLISFFSQYIHNTQSIMLINEEKQKISKYKNINQIFFFEDNIMIQKKIKNEKVFSDEDAYLSREEHNKKYSINKLPSGLHTYEK